MKTIADNKNIFIACFPKSGSSHLRVLLCNITGFKNRSFVQAYGHNEQDLFGPKINRLRGKNSVTQQHVKGTANNIKLFKECDVRPTVLVRDIFDIVLSVCDHFDQRGHRSPTCYVHKEFFSMSKEEKWMYIIRVALPWYFNFYMSWKEASNEMDVLWTSYDELFSDQVGTVVKIFDFYNISINRNKIKNAVSDLDLEKAGTKFNVGVSGRGRKLLPKGHISAIYDLADSWNVGREKMQIIGLI